jgi:hypothetical protein
MGINQQMKLCLAKAQRESERCRNPWQAAVALA